MSIQAVAWALEQEMPARPKLVLIAIANHADHTNGYCWLKAETIAGQSACTKRSVYRFIGGLIRNGYLRRQTKKGDDGKQRANDYWILFDRAETKWDWGAQVGDDDGIHDGDESPDTADDTTISSGPGVQISLGNDEEQIAGTPVDKHAVSPGPDDSGVTRKSLDEPSESNPKKSGGASTFASPPRGYHPPPIAPAAPQGALHPDASKPVFVYVGTPAWEAWLDEKKRRTGYRSSPTCWLTIDGKRREGWHFPTLFPPKREEEKESAEKKLATGPPTG